MDHTYSIFCPFLKQVKKVTNRQKPESPERFFLFTNAIVRRERTKALIIEVDRRIWCWFRRPITKLVITSTSNNKGIEEGSRTNQYYNWCPAIIHKFLVMLPEATWELVLPPYVHIAANLFFFVFGNKTETNDASRFDVVRTCAFVSKMHFFQYC